MDKNIIVSMLIVVRNAEVYIVKSIKSLIYQRFEQNQYEIIIVDGLSTDNTVLVAKKCLDENKINYKILENKNKTLASGWNIAIKVSEGKYVVRPDAHAELLDGYVKVGIEKLSEDNSLASVGGVLIARSQTYLGKMIAKVLSNPIGVGISFFRVGVKKDIYSDTVVYGVYKRKVFEEVGFFNESLERNQDIDMHLRMAEKGYKFLTTPDMCAVYNSRTSFKKFIFQAYANGYWVTYGKSGHLRHLIPMFFLLFIIASCFLRNLQFILYSFYILTVIVAYILKSKAYNPFNLFVLLSLTFTLHISYGLGSFAGVVKRFFRST